LRSSLRTTPFGHRPRAARGQPRDRQPSLSRHRSRKPKGPTMHEPSCRTAVTTAGHTHSSRSRICWISLPASVVSCSGRVPRCRSRPHVSSVGSGIQQRSCAVSRGDQHRILLISLIAGQVLGPPRARSDHRLHAHKRHRPVRGQLPQYPPPVPGRLARHRHPSPARRRGPPGRPVQRRAKIPSAAGTSATR
jgi:hypothetical protein